jgi:hypothetical protein
MFDEDLDAFQDDFDVACSQGTSEFLGKLNMPDNVFDLGGMSIQSAEYSLEFRSDAVLLVPGDTVVVAGVTYLVRRAPDKLDDGVFSTVKLSKP